MKLEAEKIAVLMGGISSERDISLMSGKAVFEALTRQGLTAELIDITDFSKINYLIEQNFTVAFNMVHGRYGEDGALQGVLDWAGIPYTGSDVLGSALSMDKVRAKRIWQALGLSTPPFMLYENRKEDLDNFIDLVGLPLCVKPALEGSSVGVQKVMHASTLKKACITASQYGQVMIEPWMIGEEYTVGILGDKALPSIQIVTNDQQFYDYKAKYLSEKTEYICPSPLNADEENLIQSIALDAFKAVKARHWGRVDFIRDLNGDFWLLEVNTIPGMMSSSLLPKSAKAAGIAFEELVRKILTLSLQTVSQTKSLAQGE